MLTLPVIAGLGAAIVGTSFISGLFGMAGGMILMGILLALLPVPAAMVLHGVTQLASNGWRAWLWRAHVDWKVAGGYLAGGLGALALFAAMQFVVDKATAFIVLGLMPFVNRAVPARFAFDIARDGHSVLCGFLCTALQLVAGVSGPILDIFFANGALDRRRVVATKAISQMSGHAMKLAYFGAIVATGDALIGPELAALGVVAALIGTTLSRRVLDAMTDVQFYGWTRRLITTAGVVYLGQGLWLMFVG